MRILLVDDHILFREGLASLFERQPDFEVTGQAGTVNEAIQMAEQTRPDLVLMDFSLPDGTGLDATGAILASQPEVQIVFLTMHEEDERLLDAIRAGAKGYLLKDLSINTLLASLRALQRGEAPISRSMTSRVLNLVAKMEKPARPPSLFDALTPRENEVLRALAGGASNADIAGRLFISENTVKNHVHNILEKLHVASRRELIALAIKNGFEQT